MQVSQFTKSKDQALLEYQREQKKIYSAIAGRGFTSEPGFMYDAMNDLEIDIKGKLSEVNYKILEEAVTRELKQQGLDSDLAYKAAALSWEIEKAELLSSLAQEIANVKNARSVEDEIVALLAIEISKRSIALIEAKTAIELEMEGYREELAALDSTTGDYEVLLAEARVTTARKKLDAIPFLTQLIEIERDILEKDFSISQKDEIILSKNQTLIERELTGVDKDGQILEMERDISSAETAMLTVDQSILALKETMINAETNLINIETDVANQKEAIIRPAMESFIAVLNLYIDELDTQLDLYNQIIGVKTDSSEVRELILGKEGELLDKKKELSDSLTELTSALTVFTNYKTEVLSSAISELLIAYKADLATKEAQANLRVAISEVKKQTALLITDQVSGELAVLDADQAKLLASIELKGAEIERKKQSLDYQTETLETEITGFNQYKTAWDLSKAEIDSKRVESFSTVKNNRKIESETEFDIRIQNSTDTESAQRTAIIGRSQSEINKIKGETAAKVDIKSVTASLNHLLSQE